MERQNDVRTVAPPRGTGQCAVDEAARELRGHAAELASLPLDRRIELIQACAAGVVDVAREWAEVACEAKRIDPQCSARAEEILAGPVAVLRYLRLSTQSLDDVRRHGRPQLPREPHLKHGQFRVPVFPTQQLYDKLLFRPMAAETWLADDASPDNVCGANVGRVIGSDRSEAMVAGVLGAGNVSAIPATDALTKILQENRAVLLKMNPVNEYLGPLFERGLRPLINAGFLQIVYGGASVGARLVEHDAIDEIHITGSIETHDAVVWGGDADERERNRAAGTPVLAKPITSELGNVTPWIVVPGKFSDAELRFQAESIAASIVNNASFNCIATKMIVTCRDWPDRERFLGLIDRILAEVSPRVAYYPGAAERFADFAGQAPQDAERLPWTLVRDADPHQSPHLFQRESFVCVSAETSLGADSPEAFLTQAVDFVNERLWGTLAAAVTVPSDLKRRSPDTLDRAFRDLRYGTIGVNQWPGVAYALMSTPWGGHPSSNLADAQSGIGFVHNTYLLDHPEKTILHCPLKFFPKPVWFPTHGNPEAIAWSLFDLYRRPSLWRLPRLLQASLRGTR